MIVVSFFVAFLATTSALVVTPVNEGRGLPPSAAVEDTAYNLILPLKPIPASGYIHGVNTTYLQDAFAAAGVNPRSSELGARGTCSGPVESDPTSYWLDAQDHKTGALRGYAPYLKHYDTYPVYRNVIAGYHAANDGTGDQSSAIQAAIDDDGRGGSRYKVGVTIEPATVFLPGGTYQLKNKIELRIGTILIGDPRNPPVIKAAPGFRGGTLVSGYDDAMLQQNNFMILMKNVIIDTTALDPAQKITALQWGVAQGCGITNVQIKMPLNSKGHTGIDLGGGSTLAVTDVQITGGAVGIQNSGQQVNFKNVHFKDCTVGYAASAGFVALLQGAVWDTCGIGAQISGTANLVIIDSTSRNSGPVVQFHDSSHDQGPRQNQVVIEKLWHDGKNPIAIESNGRTLLGAENFVDTWIWGNETPGEYATGASRTTKRPDVLVSGSKFFTMQEPTYANYAADQFVNVKANPKHPVKGDGYTDDAASLNAILAQAAADCKVAYFPFGVYIVRSTLFIPPGSRIVGEAWSVISGAGALFSDESKPQPVVKVGNKGDRGITHISTMRFSVAEVLPGAIILEINTAGNQGDVGMWNSLVTIGGTADSKVTTSCSNQDTKNCKAAFMAMHLTESSSTYIENFWAWTADHALDGVGGDQIIATGRGILVEATKGTWLVGVGSEHHWLYQFNYHSAQNVFTGLAQSETPYMQGRGAVETVPAPWTADSAYGDPDYSWCGGGDQLCRTALGQNVDAGANIFLYAGAAWAFFEGPWDGNYDKPCGDDAQGNKNICQTYMNRVAHSPKNLNWFSVNTKSATYLIRDSDGTSDTSQYYHPGSWGGSIAAYLQWAA